MADSSEIEVVRCGKLLVALKNGTNGQSKTTDYQNNIKWKKRFVTLKVDEQHGALLEVYKIKGKGDDVVLSFQMELRQDAVLAKNDIGNKFAFSYLDEIFASFDAKERDDWIADIEEYRMQYMPKDAAAAQSDLRRFEEDSIMDSSFVSTGDRGASVASDAPVVSVHTQVAQIESKLTAPSSSSGVMPRNSSGTDPFDQSSVPASDPWSSFSPVGRSTASSPSMIPSPNNANSNKYDNSNPRVNTGISSPQQPSLAAQTALSPPSVSNRNRAKPLTSSSFAKQDSMGTSMGPQRKGEAKIQAHLHDVGASSAIQPLELASKSKSSPKTQFPSYNSNTPTSVGETEYNPHGRRRISEGHENSDMTTNRSRMDSIVSSSSRHLHGHMNGAPLTTSQALGSSQHHQSHESNLSGSRSNTALSSHEISILVQLNAELNGSLEALTAQHQYEKDILTQQIGVYKHDLETLQEVNAGLVAELRKAKAAANRFPMPAQLHDEDDYLKKDEDNKIEQSSKGANVEISEKDDSNEGEDDIRQQEQQKESEMEGLQRMVMSLESVNRELMTKMQTHNDLMVDKELLIAELQEKLANSTGNTEDIVRDKESLEEKISHVELQYEKILIDNDKLQAEAKMLRGIITDHENSNKQLKTIHAMEISEAKNREQMLLSWKTEYETIAADKDKQISELQKLRDQAVEVEKLQATTFIAQEEKAKISEEMAGVKDLYSNTQEELQQTHTQLRALLKENNRLAQEDKVLRDKLETMKTDLAGKDALSIDNGRLSTEVSMLKNQLEAVRSDMSGKDLGNAARFEELQRKSSADIETMRDQLHELQAKLSETEFQLMESETNLGRESTLKTSYMEQRDHMEKRLQAEIEALKEKSHQISHIEAENSTLKISMVQFEQMSDQSIEELSTENRKLTTDLAAANTELDVVRGKLESHTKSLLELETEIDKRTKMSSDEKMGHLKQINALEESNKQIQRRLRELEVSSTALSKVQTEEIEKLRADLNDSEGKLQTALSTITELQIRCDSNEKRLVSEHNIAAEEKARRLEEHATMEKERAKRLSELGQIEAEKLLRIEQLEEEKSKRLAERKQLEIEHANCQALQEAEKNWTAQVTQLRARNDELEVLLQEEKSKGLAEHKQFEVEHANRQSLETMERKLTIEVDGLRKQLNELDIELSTTKIALNNANRNNELAEKKSKELEERFVNMCKEHDNRVTSLHQEYEAAMSDMEGGYVDMKEQLSTSASLNSAKIQEFESLQKKYEDHEKYYKNIIQCSNVLISSILDSPQVLPPALKTEGVDDIDFYEFTSAIGYAARDKAKLYQGDVLMQQLHKLFLGYRVLDRTCKDVTGCIKAEYDFVEFIEETDSDSLDVSNQSINNDPNSPKKGDLKLADPHFHLDHIINNLDVLMKQYSFARQREIEKSEFQRNLNSSRSNSPRGFETSSRDDSSKIIKQNRAEIERNKKEIAKLKADHEEYASFLYNEMEGALSDQKKTLTAKFEVEIEQLKAQMSLEYHDYIEQADALTPLRNLNKTLDEMDDVEMLQSELSKALNDYSDLKKQYDEVIIELDECIAALEVVERQKMEIETESLELKHRIKTMKARFPEGSFTTMEASSSSSSSSQVNEQEVSVRGNSSSERNSKSNDNVKINYATNSKGINRGKLSAPLSPGLMSRISNIANRASHRKGGVPTSADESRYSGSSMSPTNKGSKPSDLLRLADLN